MVAHFQLEGFMRLMGLLRIRTFIPKTFFTLLSL